jgi:hypothetical protein
MIEHEVLSKKQLVTQPMNLYNAVELATATARASFETNPADSGAAVTLG